MKLSFHPRYHGCPSLTLRELKVLSPPFAQSETQPTLAFSSAAGCATGSARLLSAHNLSGLQSLYFGLFVYQVHIVATVSGVSRRFACVGLLCPVPCLLRTVGMAELFVAPPPTPFGNLATSSQRVLGGP